MLRTANSLSAMAAGEPAQENKERVAACERWRVGGEAAGERRAGQAWPAAAIDGSGPGLVSLRATPGPAAAAARPPPRLRLERETDGARQASPGAQQ